MEVDFKKTINTGAKWATVAGSAVIAVGAINTMVDLGKKKELASMKVAMPVVTLLVAVSAFSWAMTQPVTIVPKTGA